MWPGAPAPVFEAVGNVVPDGFYNRRVTFMEHSGTHFDAPAHMVEGGALLHQIDPGTLIRPAVRHRHQRGRRGGPRRRADRRAGAGVRGGERPRSRPGRWSCCAPAGRRSTATRRATAAATGSLRFPGFGPDATRILVEERGVVGLGIDTMSIDPGNSAMTSWCIARSAIRGPVAPRGSPEPGGAAARGCLGLRGGAEPGRRVGQPGARPGAGPLAHPRPQPTRSDS